MKRSVILTDRLGPDILSAFWTKGQVLHRERAHLKVPGSSIVLACSAGGFGGLSSGLPLFWIHCRLGELGRE